MRQQGTSWVGENGCRLARKFRPKWEIGVSRWYCEAWLDPSSSRQLHPWNKVLLSFGTRTQDDGNE